MNRFGGEMRSVTKLRRMTGTTFADQECESFAVVYQRFQGTQSIFGNTRHVAVEDDKKRPWVRKDSDILENMQALVCATQYMSFRMTTQALKRTNPPPPYSVIALQIDGFYSEEKLLQKGNHTPRVVVGPSEIKRGPRDPHCAWLGTLNIWLPKDVSGVFVVSFYRDCLSECLEIVVKKVGGPGREHSRLTRPCTLSRSVDSGTLNAVAAPRKDMP
ncbi:hypothetical protein T265_07022 [Opisthorchis viverrini]|uniref:Uncharacterized protein n=1 Tax=Opisthorchis viverrini TaxID=6198 RepID=A0A074ZEG0_OPIVI|nr:hypothetical protein T265_07022 [Opisthorchis viverrini]KER25563.1 hypothetical protein T265_07022 [Opisthorchis viverrini]